MQPLGGGDYLCARHREHRDAVREQQRRDNQVAAVVDEFAAKPGRVHNASNFDRGISPWNARPKAEPGAAYWLSPPDPEPKSSQEWRLYDETRLRTCPTEGSTYSWVEHSIDATPRPSVDDIGVVGVARF